jgi:predicted nucleotidyltransferase
MRNESITGVLMGRGSINPPTFVLTGLQYETLVGSAAYGLLTQKSDTDVLGFCIPPIEVTFPHLLGEVPGFDKYNNQFTSYVAQKVDTSVSFFSSNADLTIFSIVKFFSLLLKSSPTVLRSLYTPYYCVEYTTKIGNLVRSSFDKFLSKNIYYSYMGYAENEAKKLNNIPNTEPEHTRAGYNTKAAVHAAALLMELQQLLTEHAVDIGKFSSILDEIRQGYWGESVYRSFLQNLFEQTEFLFNIKDIPLPNIPDKEEMRIILLSCLEEYYGHIPGVHVEDNVYKNTLRYTV